MATHTADNGPPQHHHAFADPAFDPQPGYDFDDAQHSDMANHMPMLNGLGGDNNPYLSMMNSFGDVGTQGNMFGGSIHGDSWPNARPGSTFPTHPRPSGHSMNPSDMWDPSQKRSPSFLTSGLPYPPSAQTDIIKSRGGTVSESYGNLTPPEDAVSEDVPSARSKPVLNRSERARNAAVQRHAKTKKRTGCKEAKKSESGSEESGDEVEDKRERYREKNRAAAAKCRAKKKTHTEQVELDARALETDNTLLKAKVRELRNQHSELRNMALQHNAGVQGCQCGAIHQYNLSKAAEITSSFSRFAPLNTTRTNSDGMTSTVPSPTGLGQHVGRSSYAGSSSMSGAGVNSPESMQMQMDEESFPDFMQSSEGRSTFAG